MENKEVLESMIEGVIPKVKNARSLLELKYFLAQVNTLIREVSYYDMDNWLKIEDFIDLDELPVFSATYPENVDELSVDCDVKSYDDTQLLCFDGLDFWLEEREYFND